MEDMGYKLTFELQCFFRRIVRLVTDWAVSDRQVLGQTMTRALQLVRPGCRWATVAKHLTFLGGPRLYDVIDYDVSTLEVSLNVPLHRFLVPVLMSTPRYAGLADNLARGIEKEVSEKVPTYGT